MFQEIPEFSRFVATLPRLKLSPFATSDITGHMTIGFIIYMVSYMWSI